MPARNANNAKYVVIGNNLVENARNMTGNVSLRIHRGG